MAERPDPRGPSAAFWAPGLTVLSAFLLNLLLYGYSFGSDPHVVQVVPLIGRLKDPGFYPADPYLEAMRWFPSLYPRLMAFLSGPVDLERLHLLLYLPVRLFWFAAVYRTAAAMFPGRRTAVLACLLAAVSPLTNVLTPLGEEPMIKSSLYHTTLAAPCLLLSMAWFLEGRGAPAFGLLAAGCALNGLAAGHVALMFLAATLWSPPGRVWRGWLTFALLMLPWLWWQGAHRPPGAWGDRQTVEILRLWYPGHYFPSLWSAAKWSDILTKVPLLLGLVWSALPRCKPSRSLRAFLAAVAAMALAAWFFGEVLPVPAVVLAQLFRGDAVFCVLALVCAADRIAAALDEPGLVPLALGALTVACLARVGPSPYPLCVLLLLVLRRPVWTRRGAAAGLLCCLGNILISPVQLWWNLSMGLLFALILAPGAAPGAGAGPPARRACVALVLGLLPLAPWLGHRLRLVRAHDAGAARQAQWRLVQEWARAETPSGAVFFVPADSQGFRVFSRRSPVTEWTDACAVHWDPAFGAEWLRRIADSMRAESLPPGAELSRLAGRYGAGYLIAPSARAFPGAALYSNPGFSVYRIAASGANGPARPGRAKTPRRPPPGRQRPSASGRGA
ncbi:MAG: hypothetical protein PHU21_05530 [Elusimicrobia bacterium]|nr:hypothetical protein [Elusimicrobiota bacterium]